MVVRIKTDNEVEQVGYIYESITLAILSDLEERISYKKT